MELTIKNLRLIILCSSIAFSASHTAKANAIAGLLVEALDNSESSNIEESSIEESKEQAVKKAHIRPGQARALKALESAKYEITDIKVITLQVKELTDNKGQKYLAGLVSRAEVSHYLSQLQTILGKKFDSYRQHQSARDHGLFHLTLVNPIEYQHLAGHVTLNNQALRVTLHGLGRVSQGEHTSYFVVASSDDGQFFRQKLTLPKKDFHVTLGFLSQDIHGVSKGLDSLLEKN